MGEEINDRDLVEQIVWDEAHGFIAQDEIDDGNSRWHIQKITITKRESDGKLFMVRWRKGATEYQDDDISGPARECEAYQEYTTKYREI